MRTDVDDEPVEFLDTLYIDRSRIVLAVKRNSNRVLTNILLNEYINLAHRLTVEAWYLCVVSDFGAGCELALNVRYQQF